MGESTQVCKTLRPRWLCLTRSAVALVVAVLAVVVVVMGLLLALRPRTLQLNISQSDVFVKKFGQTNNDTFYDFRFYLEATNPSERVFYYFNNVTAALHYSSGGASSSSSMDKLIVKFNVTPVSVSLSQREEEMYIAHGDAENLDSIDALNQLFGDKRGAEIDGAVMVLKGVVREDDTTEGTSRRYRAKYTCSPVAIKSNAELPEPSSRSHRADCLPVFSILPRLL
ncbi:hypothetical protein EJB05_54090, partial [Eragrostis curvula]